MITYDSFEKLLVNNIKEISIANGYSNDICILEGWIRHYQEKLEKQEDGYFFPAVAMRPVDEVCNWLYNDVGGENCVNNKATRKYLITGAVSVIDNKENYLYHMESLLLDVKRSLSDTRHVNLVKVEFDTPDANVGYAAFQITVALKPITEKIEKP